MTVLFLKHKTVDSLRQTESGLHDRLHLGACSTTSALNGDFFIELTIYTLDFIIIIITQGLDSSEAYILQVINIENNQWNILPAVTINIFYATLLLLDIL